MGNIIRGGYRTLVVIVILSFAFMAGQAKDYKEMTGPYEVSFELPDEIASLIAVNKGTSSSESLQGIPCDVYYLVFNQNNIPGDMGFGKLWIEHYAVPVAGDFDSASEIIKNYWLDISYTTCYSGHRAIDGHDGILLNCLDNSEGDLKYFSFEYRLDDQTIVSGFMQLGWDTGMFPFLESLHVAEA